MNSTVERTGNYPYEETPTFYVKVYPVEVLHEVPFFQSSRKKGKKGKILKDWE